MGAPIPDDARLKGPFKPMRFEATVEDCIVSQGEIPRDLCGGFYRVGPTFKRRSAQGGNGLLAMDGMVQGLVFEGGRADFRNRWVRTPKYRLEDEHGRGMFEYSDGDFGDWRDFGWGEVRRTPENEGVPQGANNVNVYPFAGEVLASGEQGGPPIALDPITLQTRGAVAWADRLSPGIHGEPVFFAHPKWDRDTGELFGLAWRDTPPYVTIHVVSPGGGVTSKPLVDAPYATVAHDIWLTPDHIVVPFQPFHATRERIAKGLGVFGWDTDLPLVLGLVPRRDMVNAAPRYVEAAIEPEYVMHTLSCNLDGDVLTLDAPIFDRPPFPFEFDFEPGDDITLFYSIAKSTLGRWTVDLATGRVTSQRLSDRPCELPKVDERHYGRGYRHGYLVGGEAKREGMTMKSLVHLDARTGSEREHTIRHSGPSIVLEPTFAPRRVGADEGDGYLIVPIGKWADNTSEFQIFDTDDITAGPIATIDIPFHMGWTPHGHWMDFR